MRGTSTFANSARRNCSAHWIYRPQSTPTRLPPVWTREFFNSLPRKQLIRRIKSKPSAQRERQRNSDLAADGHGYTRMRNAGSLARDREKIGSMVMFCETLY